MKKCMLLAVNGRTEMNREVLERNALDAMTMDPDADFNEAQEMVESMTEKELASYLASVWGEEI